MLTAESQREKRGRVGYLFQRVLLAAPLLRACILKALSISVLNF
jgi:hypothetical protein